MLSSRSLNDIHFIATGEPLPAIPGDACPRPIECTIQRTKDRQERQRAWQTYYTKLRALGQPTYNQKGTVNGVTFTHMQAQDIDSAPIFLYMDEEKVLELWSDGREPADHHPKQSPSPKFVLRAPWISEEDISPMPSPIYGVVDQSVDVINEPPSRLRRHFLLLLSTIPNDALWAELEEWQEEVERAKEHLAAVTAELVARNLATSNTKKS